MSDVLTCLDVGCQPSLIFSVCVHLMLSLKLVSVPEFWF